MLVSSLYATVCNILLEPGGFQLGLITNAQFLQFYRAVMEDFLGKTKLYKGVAFDPQQYSVAQYQIPDWLSDIEAVFSDGLALGMDNESSISGRDKNWQSRIDQPRSWRMDKLNMQTLGLFPAPIVESPLVPPIGAPYFGIVSADAPGSAPAVAANIGTIIQANQTGTYTTPGLFFGATNLAQASRGNVAMIGVLGLFTENVTLNSPIEHLTDDWVPFIQYGILAKIFGCDGETRDVLRERYCKARYDEGTMLGMAIMGEEIDAR